MKSVPDYVFTFQQGKSKRPFGRIWWDETIGTVVTFPSYQSQHYIQSKIESLPYGNMQGCKVFLTTIDSGGQLNRGIVRSAMQLLFQFLEL
ncbi:DNA (cytosine-5)-methyltransferase CMT3-like isoform X2 [Carica papaya]|uniref:DNA (cytosine-5)-methyltransferase CMT3-like isoform X2 n=1 Tax=Carica papaya TaxID=3649 RepID=UPI000B8CEFF4|nr:DNA (cytosine-5)-methyltransferase CMT3-like isoform X2 [Carica papaya]